MHRGSLRGAPIIRSRPPRFILQAVIALGLLALIGAVASPAGAINCYTEKMRTEAPKVAPGTLPGTQGPMPPAGPPPNPGVGDSWYWWLWYFAGGPPHALQKMCTVRGMGQNVYVMVNDADWNVWVDQADVDRIVANWDNSSYGQWPNEGIYQLDTGNFGPAPDRLDHDPRIYVMLYDWDVTGADGYFNSDDEDTTSVYSNRCEVVYVDASTSQPGGPSGAYLTAVMAHEFAHMIQWNADPFESAWVDEGQAELAMWFYGHPDPVTGFNTNPDNNLTSFSNQPDYIKTYLFCLYFWEHYGGTPTLLAWVANPQTSLQGVQSTLIQMGYTDTVAEVVRDWATANYLDDPNIDGGKYNYYGLDLPPFSATTKSSYPVSPVNTTLNHWAGEYVKFINGRPQELNFDGPDGATWYARVVKYIAGVPQSVEDIPLNQTTTGSFDLPGFGSEYDQVVMVVVDASPSGSTSYQYSTTDIPTSVDGPFASRPGLQLLDAGANPFTEGAALRLDLDRSARIQATVHDASGALVRTLASEPMDTGSHLLRWDGRNEAGSPVPAGVYFVHVRADGNAAANHRLVRVR